MRVVISGRPVLLRYGGPVARSLVAEYGLEVLRMPDISVVDGSGSWIRFFYKELQSSMTSTTLDTNGSED